MLDAGIQIYPGERRISPEVEHTLWPIRHVSIVATESINNTNLCTINLF